MELTYRWIQVFMLKRPQHWKSSVVQTILSNDENRWKEQFFWILAQLLTLLVTLSTRGHWVRYGTLPPSFRPSGPFLRTMKISAQWCRVDTGYFTHNWETRGGRERLIPSRTGHQRTCPLPSTSPPRTRVYKSSRHFKGKTLFRFHQLIYSTNHSTTLFYSVCKRRQR